MAPQYKGASRQHEIRAGRRRKDTRRLDQRLGDFLASGEGVVFGLFMLPLVGLFAIKMPFSGELLLLVVWWYSRKYVATANRSYDFPYRVPQLAQVRDGSTSGGKDIGKGVTLIGNDLETKEQIYAEDSDLRTHMLVLGTTGSGKPQPYHAHVLTPSGWRRMGDLQVGDVVCTPDGKRAAILQLFEQGEREVWRLQTRCGRYAEATGDHLWRVVVREPCGAESARTLTTDEIRALIDRKARVLLPQVRRRKGGGAKFNGWARIWKVERSGVHPCRCIEIDHPHHLYVTNGNLVTHNTEFLLGLVFNALVQNTGFIYVDGKGDPKLQKEIFRLARYLGREDDLLIINFITSGRDFVEKQVDKVTNNMNIMGNTSSGMLIELIVSLMDDAGGSGDMWKGRCISFVAALTRPLTYLRDKGYINLSPEKYLEFFELNVIEELVWEHNGRYGPTFDTIVAPLRSYLVTLPGYQKSKVKKQEQKTLEQHGFIVMQLTRIFNDLTFNYGHIFKTKVGDVDFFDVVLNRRLLVVLLPALERAPDSLRMLGKMIVGSIKQMMAGCLGNRVEGQVREIIDSRPTNAAFPFYTILDEYGYYAVIGFAVAPAQARSLGFSVIFAAQDFSSLKKSSAEEADATWENTNIRAVGRITSGQRSETWERIQGASGEADEARLGGFDRKVGGLAGEVFRAQENMAIERRARLDYDDLAMQEKGEFTFLIGKKEKGGSTGGVRVIRGMGFYTAGPTPKEMRINDLLPVEAPEPADLPQNRKALEGLIRAMLDGSLPSVLLSAIQADPLLTNMHRLFEGNYADPDRPRLDRVDAAFGVLGWYLGGGAQIQPAKRAQGAAGAASTGGPGQALEPSPGAAEGQGGATLGDPLGLQRSGAEKALFDVLAQVVSTPKERESSGYASATPAGIADDGDEIVISAELVTTNILMTDEDSSAFRDKALPLLRQHLYMMDDMPSEEEWEEHWAVAARETLVDMEVVATGEGFNSLEEKWAVEDSVVETREAIARSTSYIEPPVPEAMDVGEAHAKLKGLSAHCNELIRSEIGGFGG